MLTKDSEIVVYIKKILNKLTSTITRKIPWFEQFEHIFLFEFIQVIHQEVKQKKNFFFHKIFFSSCRNLRKIYHRYIMKYYFHYYLHC